MKYLLTIAVALLGTALTYGAVRSIEEIMKTPVKELTPEEHAMRTEYIRKVRTRIFGENVVKPNSQQGKIVFVNAQSKLPLPEIESAIAAIYKCAKFKFEIKVDAAQRPTMDRAATACSDFNAQIAIVIVYDENIPAVLAAPEDQWAVVNVAKLDRGLASGPLYARMFASRCRKEIIRTFSLLCGGGASQFPGNMMATSKIEDLDSVQEFIPIDMERRWTDYLANHGVKPAYIRTYQQACKEGWAAPPTNDIQQAIWNKVHAIPDKPIKIEFDPKKDK